MNGWIWFAAGSFSALLASTGISARKLFELRRTSYSLRGAERALGQVPEEQRVQFILSSAPKQSVEAEIAGAIAEASDSKVAALNDVVVSVEHRVDTRAWARASVFIGFALSGLCLIALFLGRGSVSPQAPLPLAASAMLAVIIIVNVVLAHRLKSETAFLYKLVDGVAMSLASSFSRVNHNSGPSMSWPRKRVLRKRSPRLDLKNGRV